MKIRMTLIKIATCAPLEFKILCNRITARRVTKTNSNPSNPNLILQTDKLVWKKQGLHGVDKVKMLMLNCRWTAAARKIANGSVLSETLVILSDSFAADFYTISTRQLSNRRGNFKVCSKEREEPKPNIFWCSNHRALIEVTDLVFVNK